MIIIIALKVSMHSKTLHIESIFYIKEPPSFRKVWLKYVLKIEVD